MPGDPVTTDGHRSSPRAVRETLGNEGVHRTNVSLNNCYETMQFPIKQVSTYSGVLKD